MSMFINNENKLQDLKFKFFSSVRRIDNFLCQIVVPTVPLDYNGPLGLEKSKKWVKMIDDKNSFYPLLFGIMFGTIAPLLSQPNPNWFNGMIACFAALSTVTLFLKGRRDNEEKDERISKLELDNKEKAMQIAQLNLDINNIKKHIGMK